MAADIAQAGLGWRGVWAFLSTRNPLKRLVIQAVAQVMIERRQKLDRSLANEIANAVGKMLGGSS